MIDKDVLYSYIFNILADEDINMNAIKSNGNPGCYLKGRYDGIMKVCEQIIKDFGLETDWARLCHPP